MRKLSSEQKEQLQNHIAKRPVEYIELYNELYDHYASAYENGELSLEETLNELDEHFNYQKVKSINSKLLKKTKKTINDLYWREFKSFWRWPQVLTTICILLIGFFLFQNISVKGFVWFIIMPLLLFNVGLNVYGPLLKSLNKVGGRKLNSAHFNVSQHYINLPLTIFNLTTFLPIIVLSSEYPGIHFYESYPFVLFVLFTLFISSAIIGFKVFRTKIKIQYI